MHKAEASEGDASENRTEKTKSVKDESSSSSDSEKQERKHKHHKSHHKKSHNNDDNNTDDAKEKRHHHHHRSKHKKGRKGDVDEAKIAQAKKLVQAAEKAAKAARQVVLVPDNFFLYIAPFRVWLQSTQGKFFDELPTEVSAPVRLASLFSIPGACSDFEKNLQRAIHPPLEPRRSSRRHLRCLLNE